MNEVWSYPRYELRPHQVLSSTSWLIVEMERDGFIAEFRSRLSGLAYLNFLEEREELEKIMGKYELPCGCQVEPQYLPLQGGERHLTCLHGKKWIVEAERIMETRFKPRLVGQVEGEEEPVND